MIELQDVSFTYNNGNEKNCLQHINLKIKSGETILICGKSGCGKTTLTRLINGLIPHYYNGNLSGAILMDGVELATQPMYETAKKVGSVFQNPRTQFYNVDTTSEIVFGCENMGLPVHDILERLHNVQIDLKLDHLLDKNLFALSGGEKQKIACASVYASYPETIILDEPSSNLDIASIRDLKNVVSLWKKQGKTIIVAEHRLYYIVPLADRIIYMQKGVIEREFTREEFQQLSTEELMQMGLRSLDPFALKLEAQKHLIPPMKITIRDFRFKYKKQTKPVLNIPLLQLPENEIIGVIGNNGAGKSTFARCLCGLDKLATGTLDINGQSYSTKQRPKLSYMVMQDVNHQLFTESVMDEILLSMEGDNEEKDIESAKELLLSLDLIDKGKLHPMSLSGGEKQRVAIGSLIACNKQILVFDEPTSGLDHEHMLEVANNLKNLQRMGKSLFIITHDPEFIYKSCTYLLLIENGRALWCNPMNEKTVTLLNQFFLSESTNKAY
ncbi:ABC transporter ATP-binding protein [Clostridium botulinum]